MAPRDPAHDDRGRNPQRRPERANEKPAEVTLGQTTEEAAQRRRRQSYWRKPNNWVQLGTLLAVLTYTGFQIWQTQLIRSNNIVSQRAFVYVAPTPGLAAFDARDRATKLVIFNMPIINSGNTPTKDLKVLVRCIPSLEALIEPWNVLHNEPVVHRPIVIAPHGSSSIPCTFTAEQLIQVKKGTMHAYVLADVTYRDRLDQGTLHTTEAEWELANPIIDDNAATWGGIQWSNVGNHNCADEECPAD